MAGTNEASSRVKIDAQLKVQGWDVLDINAVRFEYVLPDKTKADNVLCDRNSRAPAVIEVKKAAILGNTRKGPRVFASVTTVAILLRRLGIDRFTVDATQYVPGRARSARPDRAAAMKSVVLSKDGAKARGGKK